MSSKLCEHAWNDLRLPIYYEVAPTYGKCPEGWMNIGAG